MKKTWVRKTLSIGVLAAGALLLAPAAAAQADIDQTGFGNVGGFNGGQVAVPVAIPVNQVGNADSLLGISQGSGSGLNAIGGGHKGNRGGWNDGIAQQSVGNFGFGNGNQIAVPVAIPINQCGNATSLGGISYAAAACTNAIGVDGRKSIVVKKSHKRESFGTDRNLLGNNAVGNLAHNLAHGTGAKGVQAGHGNLMPGHGFIPGGTFVPGGHVVNGAGGFGNFGISGNRHGGDWGGIRQSSVGNFGLGNGNQYAAPITIPINVCGNSLSFLGTSYSSANCANVIGGDVKKVKVVKGHNHDDDGDVAGDDGGYGDEMPDDTGDVRGDNGYNDAGEMPDDAGYGDEAPADVADDAGYGDEAPADVDEPGDAMDAGYGDELPDNYSSSNGGRASEKTTLGRLTDLGGVRSAGLGGGLGLLNTLR
ncbi:chaplin family protein [Actinoplanes sp. NPDC023714]|uniref:chaplin family protein n=1 Tax=Actinoplanes sp. NPDC023714 TaxID=3154322 RepID=UPI003407CFA9